MKSPVKQYLIVTLSYWAFTLTDGALRMLVLLYFYQQGFSPLQLASVFVLYELCGVVTNLLGGWIAARTNVYTTLHIGLALQVVALALLLVEESYLTVTYVMLVQAMSGIAKDLNKMSAKSSIKLLVSDEQQGKLFRWVAWLTGSKNTLKGLGFFIGSGLLSAVGFTGAVIFMALMMLTALVGSVSLLDIQPTRSGKRTRFREIFSSCEAVNCLSAARFFLFGARDVWFVIALPVYLKMQLHWSHMQVGSFLALWIIVYGFVQSMAPMVTGQTQGEVPDGKKLMRWSLLLSVVPVAIAFALSVWDSANIIVVVGLALFGLLFAINSSVHSYLIVAYADRGGVTLDVGFYYMANAAGRLVGTVLSGLVYQWYGLQQCLIVSTVAIAIAGFICVKLPDGKNR